MPRTTCSRVRLLFPAITTSVEDTMDLGETLAERCPPGSVLALHGDLGTGKTHLVKGIARGLGIDPTTVRSPSFTILSVYEEGERPLYHFDAYRVEDPDEFVELGYEEYVYGTHDGITCIEWADRVESFVPTTAIRLSFHHVAPSERRITLGASVPDSGRADATS